MIRLIDETRDCEAVAERIHEAPTRQSPAAAVELLEPPRCNTMLVDLQALADPDASGIAEDEVVEVDVDVEGEEVVAPPDPGLPKLRSESEGEEEAATLMYVPMMKNAMPPTVASAQSIATGARRGRKRVRLLLCLGVLVVLGLGVFVVLGVDPWGMTDASIHASLGL